MNQLDRQVATRLTQYYVVALTLVAILTLSGLWFVKRTIQGLDDDGRVVNVAGRQRMLSQQLTKLAILRTQGIVHQDQADFGKLADVWSQSHEDLRNGLLRMEKVYVVRKSALLDSMFTDLQQVFESMHTSFRIIDSPVTTNQEKQAALTVILEKEPSFLSKMDAIVFRFDAESLQRVQYLARVEWLLTLTTLLVLFLEGVFVFRPVVNYTKKVIRMLTESEEQLKAANEKLVVTQKQLLETTEEKYQLQITEETVRAAALLEGQEEERKRFARELHDGIGQMLTGLRLHVEKLRQAPFENEKQKQRVEELRGLLQDTIQNTRQVAYNLMPSVLSDFGLDAALRLLVEQTVSSSDMRIEYVGTGMKERLPPVWEIGLYRIAQEALNNAVKHSGATLIKVSLRRLSEITLTVKDNGIGFDRSEVTSKNQQTQIHHGLENITTRARLLHGSLEIMSKVNKGTKIEVKLHI